MGVEIRTITEDEVEPWAESMRVGFLGHLAEGGAEAMRPFMDLGRTRGAFDGGRVVGTLRSFPTTLTVPRGEVSCAALTNVTVAATHRRQGILTEMLTADLAESVERGEATGSLIAAEYPIYGRFGYGPAVHAVDLVLDAAAAFRDPAPSGSVEMVTREELRAAAPEVYESMRTQWPGAIPREPRWWDTELRILPWPGRPEPSPRYFVLGRDTKGRPDAVLVYHVTERWNGMRPASTLHVEDLFATTDEAEARLWRYCTGVDWIATVEAEARSLDDLLPWLLVDARMVTHRDAGDHQWVRVLDPVTALARRRYAAEGRVVLDIHDPQGHAQGRVELEGGPEGATCRRTRRGADLRLGVDALGAAYLGGVGLATLARSGRVEEVRRGALTWADAMFGWTRPPWCITNH